MSPYNLLQKAALGLSMLTVLSNAAPTTGFRLQARDLSFDYNSQKVRGVNLGGWLVTEPWITPSIYEKAGDGAIDEYTLCQTLGKDAALSLLSAHWASWITAGDLANIAAAGLNHVRIPIGYWSVAPLDGDPYVQGALEYLDQAVGWAGGAGLKVLIDLHGAPGSQNGFDNSGRKGAVGWGGGDTVAQTLNAVRILAERYAGNTGVVTAIELMNEPLPPGVNLETLRQFYNDGFGTIRGINGDTAVVLSDAFQGASAWNGFMPGNNIIIDTHIYQVFDTGSLQQTPEGFFGTACSKASQLLQADKPTIVGEWCGALTDCAKWLNGKNTGARYDGTFGGGSYIGSCDGKSTGSVAALSDADKYNIRRYIEAQLDAYEAKTGWVYWTWKTEGAPEWDMQAQLAGGLFPQPLTSRQYPGQCANVLG